MLAGLLIVDGGGGRRAAAHGKAKGNGNQGLAVIEKQKAELGAYQRATHGPKNLHELDSPRESLLLCAARKLSQFSAERPSCNEKETNVPCSLSVWSCKLACPASGGWSQSVAGSGQLAILLVAVGHAATSPQRCPMDHGTLEGPRLRVHQIFLSCQTTGRDLLSFLE